MVDWVIALYGFLSVLLRGFVLSAQSFTVGGVVFSIAVASPESGISESVRQSIYRWIRCWAFLLAVAEVFYVALDFIVLMRLGGFAFREVITANFALAGFLAATSAITICVLAGTSDLRRPMGLLAPAVLIIVAATMTSHAMARLDNRLPLAVLTAAHQAAAAAWIGGLAYLLISLKQFPAPAIARNLCAKFSRLAMLSVGVLAAAGFGLSRAYVASWDAAYGSSYGIMVLGK